MADAGLFERRDDVGAARPRLPIHPRFPSLCLSVSGKTTTRGARPARSEGEAESELPPFIGFSCRRPKSC
jgi:hypothetical protein